LTLALLTLICLLRKKWNITFAFILTGIINNLVAIPSSNDSTQFLIDDIQVSPNASVCTNQGRSCEKDHGEENKITYNASCYPKTGGNGEIINTCFQITVRDYLGNWFKVAVTFSSNTIINSVMLENQTTDKFGDCKGKPPSSDQACYLPIRDLNNVTDASHSVAGGINLTYYYKQQKIEIPNSITLDFWGQRENNEYPVPDAQVLYFRWLIN